jgi:hypothetical protein
MKDYSYRYSVRMTLTKGFMTPSGWATRSRIGHAIPPYLAGPPTAAKLARYVADYNESLLPDGVNSHIGPSGYATAASIFDHHNNRQVVATWSAS